MPRRDLRPIHPLQRHYERELLTQGIKTINDVMDAYRRAAGASFHHLESMSRDIGDRDLVHAASSWHAVCIGRAGIPQPPSPQHLVAFAYLLNLDLEDLGVDPADHPSMAGALGRLKGARVPA